MCGGTYAFLTEAGEDSVSCKDSDETDDCRDPSICDCVSFFSMMKICTLALANRIDMPECLARRAVYTLLHISAMY